MGPYLDGLGDKMTKTKPKVELKVKPKVKLNPET
jgi:hypothetical protein